MTKKELIKPRAIIFDCFNTLVSNNTDVWMQTFELIVLNCDLSVSINKLFKIWKKHESLFRENRIKKIHTNQSEQELYSTVKPFKTYSQVWKDCLETTSSELKLDINIGKALNIILDQHAKRKLFLESKPILKSLANEYNLYVLSNADNCFLYPCLEPLNESISSILSSETIRLYKPDAEIFRNFLTTLDIHPNEAWYVGDNYLDDIVGSHSAGLQPVWINRNNIPINHDHKINTFIKIPNLNELANILNNKSNNWRILND